MKLFIATILSLILLSNSFRSTVVYGWYVLDLDSFVEQLCENKDNVKLECNGKCFLTKINQDTSKDESSLFPAIEWDQLVYFSPEFSENFEVIISIPRTITYWRVVHYKDTSSNAIFHPPRFS